MTAPHAVKLTVSPQDMALEAPTCRVVFSVQLPSRGSKLPTVAAGSDFVRALTHFLGQAGYQHLKAPLPGTLGVTRGCFTTFKQPFVFSVEEAEQLEAHYGGRFSRGIFEASFQREGGPHTDRRLVINVPDHFPEAEVHRLLSSLPNVHAVTLEPALDSLGLIRTAWKASLSTTGPLPRVVPLFAPNGSPLTTLTGRLCPPLRLDVIHVTRRPLPVVPRERPPTDPVLPRSCVWGQPKQQQ